MLKELFGNQTKIKILKVFFEKPDGEFYQREIVKKTGLPLTNVQYELKKLEKIKLLKKREKQNRTFYKINREFLFYPELRDIIFKAVQNDLI